MRSMLGPGTGATYCHISTTPTRLHDGGGGIEIHYGSHVGLRHLVDTSQISSGTGCGATDFPVDGLYTRRCFLFLLGRTCSPGTSAGGATSGARVARGGMH